MLFSLVIYFLKNLEGHRDLSSEDGSNNHLRTQPSRSAGGSQSRHSFNESTSNTTNNESHRGRPEGSASFSQLASGVSRMKQAQRKEMVPFVRYDGVVEGTEATNIHAHREVKVIVHRSTSSSSSSTVSSLRSVEQRMASPRSKHVQSRDHSHHHRLRHQSVIEQSDSRIRSHEQSRSSCTVEKLSDRGEPMQLQVMNIAEDASHRQTFCETSQNTTKEGGSLAAMFDS